jgi:CoA:oxalate CoA-transferase
MAMHNISLTPLAGLTVVEAGNSAAAAFGTRLLLQLGATVLRLRSAESGVTTAGAAASGGTPQERDRVRAEQVFLDDGKQIENVDAAEAYAAADVIIRGSDGAPDAPGPEPEAHYESLRADNNALVYVYLSPFGLPVSTQQPAWRGDDIQAQAVGGLSSLVGRPDREPLVVPYDVVASSQGLNAACATLGALLGVRAGHPGSFVDIGAADVAASYSRMYTLLYRFYGIAPVRAGRRAPGSGGRYPMTILPCLDGDVVLIGRSRRDWERYLDMMGRPPWSQDPRYQDPLGIAMEYPHEVDALIGPWLAERTRAELGALAQQYGVPLGSVRSVSEVLDDPQMRFRNFFRPAETGTRASGPGQDRPVLLPGFPALFRRPGQDPRPSESSIPEAR